MRHLVINKFHYLSTFIIKSTRKCSDRFNTFPLYEKQPGWISRVSVTCPIKVWGNCPPRHRRQCREEDTKIHLSPCTSYVHPAQPNANVRGVTDCDVEMVSSSVCEHIDGWSHSCHLSSRYRGYRMSAHWTLELQTKVKRRFANISQSQRRPLLGLVGSRCFKQGEGPSRGLFRDCEIFANLRITLVWSSTGHPALICSLHAATLGHLITLDHSTSTRRHSALNSLIYLGI